MKNSTKLAAALADGLRIVDEDGVSFENEFENEAIHQEMADLNIDHVSELEMARYWREQEEGYAEDFHCYLPYI